MPSDEFKSCSVPCVVHSLESECLDPSGVTETFLLIKPSDLFKLQPRRQ